MTWAIDRDKRMTAAEVLLVLRDLRRKAKRSKLSRRNLILFELAVCCGLRVSELTRLRLCDIRLGVSPSLRVPASIAKGSKSRTIPLIWDVDALADFEAWLSERRREGAGECDLVITTRRGTQIDRFSARQSFVRACKVLGRRVTIHAGRHTWVSHAVRCRSLAAVRDAAGHSSIATTDIYTHLVEQDERPGSLYAAQSVPAVHSP